jgi:hypothetical protein
VGVAGVLFGFKALGADRLQSGTAGGVVYSATLPSAHAGNFITQLNTYLVTHGVTLAAGDIVVVGVDAGPLAGFLAVQDIGGGGIDPNDWVVRLAGGVPVLTGGDFF